MALLRVVAQGEKMRSVIRRAVVLSACATAAIVVHGCKGKEQTEYVAGVSTQVSVPRDLKAVRVDVRVGGVAQFCRGYKVYDGKIQLPRSLGSFALSDDSLKSGPITVGIVGVAATNKAGQDRGDEDPSNDFYVSCTQPKVGENSVRLLRTSRQPYVKDAILFLPMPLKYACYDKQCDNLQDGTEMTCKGGKCVPATLSDQQIAALPPYTPDLVDGTGSTCFSTKLCMAARLPAIPIDPNTCTFAVPASQSEPATLPGTASPFKDIKLDGKGVNVEAIFDGGLVSEVLDLENEDGFIVPDPTKQVFRLSDGLCELYKGYEFEYDASGQVVRDPAGQPKAKTEVVDGKTVPKATKHRISAVRASGTCQAKRPAQPLCASDQLSAMGLDPGGTTTVPPPTSACKTAELKPPSAAFMVVVDNTTNHNAFFTSLNKNVVDPNDEESLIQPAIKGALSDPAFQRTDVGLIFSPGDQLPTPNGCNPTAAPEIVPGPVLTTRDTLITRLLTVPQVNSNVFIEGAMQRAYNELKKPNYDSYFRRAVLVVSNRQFTTAAAPEGCGLPTDSPLTLAKAASEDATKPIQTYVMQLTKEPVPPNPWDASLLAIEGKTGAAAYQSKQATTKFQEIVNSLTTCVYDANPGDFEAGDTVAFADPLSGNVTKASFVTNPECQTESPADAAGSQGWGKSPAPINGKDRIFFCPKTCADYRNILQQTATFTALYKQPPLPVPVNAYKAVCK
jgi:hypothetical protein